MSQMSDAMKRNSKRLSLRQNTMTSKVFQNSQSMVGAASRTNSQSRLRHSSNERSQVIMPAWDLELEDLPEPMRTQL